ncbi:MAG: HEAT repeat domain-containing protein [Deltaproteobacteria bacterium]|nr:HEAT repeat domain-containing protein [Deltaproteobacteria bacterium]
MPEMDAVDWASFEDAYGPATAVPALIRELSSPDPADRAWALEGLDACIHHQCSVYSGSTAAVPFLVALAENPEVEQREQILYLLAGIGAPGGARSGSAQPAGASPGAGPVRQGPLRIPKSCKWLKFIHYVCMP